MSSDTKSEFVISREFAAPRDLVFKMWTQREHLLRWWGPKGFKVTTCNVDLRPGGVFHYGLQAPDGSDLWGKWVYREIAAPEKLIFVSSFSDEHGNSTRHAMAPVWPLETLTTLTLEERDGKTTLTMRAVPINASPEEIEVFASMHASLQQGWGGTLEQFEAELAAVQQI